MPNSSQTDKQFTQTISTSLNSAKKVSFIPYLGLQDNSTLSQSFEKKNFKLSNKTIVIGLAVNF